MRMVPQDRGRTNPTLLATGLIIKTRGIPLFELIYTADGVKPDPDRVGAIRALRTPQDTNELQ